jgi:hypothetical protein
MPVSNSKTQAETVMAVKFETFETKLGKTSKAGERSRIWLEGKRLVAFGFTTGALFARDWDDKGKVLQLHLISEERFAELPRADKGTVSGKGDKPIIDIVGTRVNAMFGRSETVKVHFVHGVITITN